MIERSRSCKSWWFRYSDADQALYDKCLRESSEKLKAHEADRERAKAQWEEITKAAAAKGITVNA